MWRGLSPWFMTRLLAGLLALLILEIASGVGYTLWRQRQDALAQRMHDAELQAQMFEDQLTQLLHLTDLTLQGLAEGLDVTGTGAGLNESLQQTGRRLAFLRSLSCVADERIIASSVVGNVGATFDDENLLPPREGLATADFLRIGTPHLGRDLQAVQALPGASSVAIPYFFPVVRETTWQGNPLRFVATMNADYFVNTVAGFVDASLTRVDVLRYDGHLLISSDEHAIVGSQLLGRDQLAHLQAHGSGRFADQLTVFRASRDYPVFIVLHVDEAQALAVWRSEARNTLLLSGMALLTLLLLGSLLIQRIRRNLASEQDLQETRNLVARVFQDSSNGILIADAQGCIVAVNARFEKTSGRAAHSLIGQDLRALAVAEQGEEGVLAIEAALHAQDVWRGEIVNHRPDGSLLHEWLSLSLVRNREGEVINYLGIFEDLTEARRRDGLIHRLSQALEQSPTSIIITNLDWEIEYVNPHFTRVTGYSPGEMLGKKPLFLQSVPAPDSHDDTFWITLQRGQTWQGEFTHRDKHDEVRHVRAIVSPIRDADGAVTHYVAIELDVTEQHRQATQLEEARRAAEAANIAKSNFLANMSHEIRTPMNGIIGMSELLLDTLAQHDQRDYARTIRNSAQALLTILNDILDFSKIEANKLSFEELPFAPLELTQDVLNMLRVTMQHKGLALRLELPSTAPLLLGDPGRVRQILLNLLDNAVKFTSQGEVTLTLRLTSLDAGRVELCYVVRDTGIGMPQDVVDKLFSPFYQGDASMTRRFGGTGLGLSICRRLAELMHGDIQVTSTQGQGSEFTVRLQLQLADQIEASDRLASPALPSGCRVLLVEDNAVNQHVALFLLERLGCAVVTVAEGQQALATLQVQPFDVVLMDCQMPVMDGFEATRRLRAGEAGPAAVQVPVVAMTAHAMQGDRDTCLAAGMNDYLSKPITLQALEQVLARQWRRAASPLPEA